MFVTQRVAGDPDPALDMPAGSDGPAVGDEPSVSEASAAEPFTEFYRAHAERIYRALALALRNDDLAREAVDEAMTRAYMHWGHVTTLDNPAGWVFRVGLNWATSWWRKVRREQTRLTEARQPALLGPDPAGLAARAAVERLPLAQRVVVICRVLLELSTAETAAVLSISEGTVKSRLSRSLTALRQALTEGGER